MSARIFWAVWRFAVHPWTRYVAAWVALLGAAAWLQYFAHIAFSNARKPTELQRGDGNDGHTSIDFAGQWLMGRMLTRGYGRELYDRNRQIEVATAAFPRELEAPGLTGHDAENLVWLWFMDCDSLVPRKNYEYDGAVRAKASLLAPLMANDPLQAAVLVAACQKRCWTPDNLSLMRQKRLGGPLYPPIHAFLFAPLACDDNLLRSYYCLQWLLLGLAFAAGLGLRFLTRGRIWWPVATALVLFFPGFEGAHHLGQNGPLSLAILIWGWVLIDRGWDGWGGVVWGLLAYKPTWAVAFFLVPLLTRRSRLCLTMAATGTLLAVATLPFVGIESWLDWLAVGRMASLTYDADPNWIPLSRDLLSIPRRFLQDFDEPYYHRDRWYLQLAGWGLWALVLEATVRLTLLCRRETRATTGPAAAFVLLGAWIACLHFMYYDVLLAALGLFVLFTKPAELVRPLLLVVNPPPGFRLTQAVRDYFRPRLATTYPFLPDGAKEPGRTRSAANPVMLVANSFVLYALAALIVIQVFFSYWNISATFQMGLFPARNMSSNGVDVLGSDGKPKMKTPHLEVTTNQAGPPWDTYVLLGVWLWAGVHLVRKKLAEGGADGGQAARGPGQSN